MQHKREPRNQPLAASRSHRTATWENARADPAERTRKYWFDFVTDCEMKKPCASAWPRTAALSRVDGHERTACDHLVKNRQQPIDVWVVVDDFNHDRQVARQLD